MNTKYFILSVVSFFCFSIATYSQKTTLNFCGSASNDLYVLLSKENLKLKRFDSPEAAINQASKGTGILFVSDSYPKISPDIKPSALEKAKKKGLRLYIEYSSSFTQSDKKDSIFKATLERGVVTSDVFGKKLKQMSILGINGCHLIPVNVSNPIIVLGKVAGFDKAEYGINDIKTHPLLFQKDNMLVATTKLSDFATGRYGPEQSWKQVWNYIISWVSRDKNFSFSHWLSYVDPMYAENTKLPGDAIRNSIAKGAEWFFNAHFFIAPSWKELWLEYQGDGLNPVGPAVSQQMPNGDGSLGILEGHVSNINYDGTQQYRYWVRADVQGEVAYALAAAGNLLHKGDYFKVANNLADNIFYHSNLRSGNKNDPNSPAYGLIGWSVTHPGVFYGDDNARCILGLIGASAYMNTSEWDTKILEAILANFRTTGKEGFRGSRLSEGDILKEGWKHFENREIINPHPHFESWLWACYLWLYDKTGYKPLLQKAKEAVRLTMEAYPDKWKWTNGIQQERARMILPLAWLVRVEDTPEHRHWLDQVVERLLLNQMECGAIREELGGAGGSYGRTASNKAYGLREAPLIFENGDPVADMLYTSNFAFFSLNEAAHATGNKKYMNAVHKLSDFLTRIQIKSSKHKDLDGGWFRAFDYNRWDYWASNADAGWGAWSTLTGWIQSWMITTQLLVEKDNSYWQLTKKSMINKHMPETIKVMGIPLNEIE
ncbi:MAG: hypothetical protein ABI325_06420 [Ginsengibacter sp.]